MATALNAMTETTGTVDSTLLLQMLNPVKPAPLCVPIAHGTSSWPQENAMTAKMDSTTMKLPETASANVILPTSTQLSRFSQALITSQSPHVLPNALLDLLLMQIEDVRTALLLAARHAL